MSIINGLEYGNEQWNGKWNETVKVHSCSYQGNLRIMSVRCGTGRSERKKSRGRRNDIGAGTGPAGPAVARPFSAEVDTIITRSTFVWSQIAALKFGRVRT